MPLILIIPDGEQPDSIQEYVVHLDLLSFEDAKVFIQLNGPTAHLPV